MSSSDVALPIRPALRLSVACWLLAVAAGVFETLLVVLGVGDSDVSGPALWVGVTLRLVVFAIALAMIRSLARGSRRARWMLTILLGVLGLASIVVPAVISMADGQSLLDAFGDDGRLPLAFALSRLTHAGAVVVATIAMWWPGRHTAREMDLPTRSRA